jgi:putative intracellular protease/amidase
MKRLAVLLTEGYADWECGQLLASAREDFKFNVFTASLDGNMVTSMGAVRTLVDASFDRIDPVNIDCLVLCGGTIWESEKAPDLNARLQEFAASNCVLGAICGATLALARAGLLNETAHTSNAPKYLAAAENYRGEAFYRDVPHAVRSGRIVTAAGTAPITFTAEIYRALGLGSAELDEYVTLFGREFPR